MPTETKTDKTAEPPKEFVPRKLKLIVGSSRGEYLVDAETGEDLRLPTCGQLRPEMFGPQANVHLAVLVVGVERERQ